MELLKVAKTRFATNYVSLKRLLDCREALATIIVFKLWKEWIKNGDEKMRTMGALVSETTSNDKFWDEIRKYNSYY